MNKKLNKKGFTLIELLAVIVVLGIILAIAIPLVTNSINDSKKGSFKSSAEMVLKEVEKQNVLASNMGDTATSAKAINSTTSSRDCTLPNKCVLMGTESTTNVGYTKSNLGLSDDFSSTNSKVWIDDNNKINLLLCAEANGKFDNMGTHGTDAAADDDADCVLVVEQ